MIKNIVQNDEQDSSAQLFARELLADAQTGCQSYNMLHRVMHVYLGAIGTTDARVEITNHFVSEPFPFPSKFIPMPVDATCLLLTTIGFNSYPGSPGIRIQICTP